MGFCCADVEIARKKTSIAVVATNLRMIPPSFVSLIFEWPTNKRGGWAAEELPGLFRTPSSYTHPSRLPIAQRAGFGSGQNLVQVKIWFRSKRCTGAVNPPQSTLRAQPSAVNSPHQPSNDPLSSGPLAKLFHPPLFDTLRDALAMILAGSNDPRGNRDRSPFCLGRRNNVISHANDSHFGTHKF